MVEIGAEQVAEKQRSKQKKTQHVLSPLGGTPGTISPIFLYDCAPWPLTYIQGFIQISSGLEKL